MQPSTRTWLLNFISGLLATILGIAITFGVQSWVNTSRRSRTAHLLAEQIVGKMGRTYEEMKGYHEIFDTIDSTSMRLHLAILADTLERVDSTVADAFLGHALGEWVMADTDDDMAAYKTEILNTIGDVELVGHIDEFYSYARQYALMANQVSAQKRVVADMVYGKFYGDYKATLLDYVRYLHELPEFNIYYSRMQNIRLSLEQLDSLMSNELETCKRLLHMETDGPRPAL